MIHTVLLAGTVALAQAPMGEPSCDEGDAAACRTAGLAWVHGDGRGRDFELGIRLLKRACALSDNRSCADVDALLQAQLDLDPARSECDQRVRPACERAAGLATTLGDVALANEFTQRAAQLPPPPPSKPGPITEPPPKSFDEEGGAPGSRWGVAGRLAGGVTGSFRFPKTPGSGSFSLGTGTRYALFEPQYDRVYVGPALALLVDAQIFDTGLVAVGLEARLELDVAPPGGMLEPWFNVWLCGGARAAIGHDYRGATQYVGVGIGGNGFAGGWEWLRGSHLNSGGGFGGAIATAIGVVLIGMLHMEGRVEVIDGSDLLYHFIIGIGF